MEGRGFVRRVRRRMCRLVPRNRMPNCFLVGAGKAGTTSLYYYLRQHPNVFFPQVKEPNYFAFGGDSIEGHEESDRPWIAVGVRHWPAYKKLFRMVANEAVIGDASPIYLYHQKSAQRISEYNRHAKIVMILRCPFDRAYSDFMMHRRTGRETRSFEEALRQDFGKRRFFVGSYLEKSLYGEQVRRYMDRFPEEQIKILRYEELCNDPRGIMGEIFDFVNVEKGFQVDVSRRYNAAPEANFVSKPGVDFMREYVIPDLDLLERLTELDCSVWKRS